MPRNPLPQPYPTISNNFEWLAYPFANDYGGKEPYGNFPKPDLNIQVPPGYPIGNVTPGIVTNVDTSSAWGYTVTIKMDSSVNSLATHAAYLHMGSVSVSQGQHVAYGDVLGTSGPPSGGGFQNAPLGFAFYPGDKYGFGPEWNTYFASSSTPDLNPYDWLRNAASLPPNQKQAMAQQPDKGCAGKDTNNCAPWDITCIMCALGSVVPRIGKGILGGILMLTAAWFALRAIMDMEVPKVIGKAVKDVQKGKFL